MQLVSTPKHEILVIDDDLKVLTQFQYQFKNSSTGVHIMNDGGAAVKLLQRQPERFVAVYIDQNLDGVLGTDLAREIRSFNRQITIKIMSGDLSGETVDHYVRCDTDGFYEKPLKFDEKIVPDLVGIKRKHDVLMKKSNFKNAFCEKTGIIGESTAVRTMIKDLLTVAKEEISVLLRGEPGTGKELAARAIHNNSTRSKGPFIAVNCGAIPANLFEGELFGQVKGAFTGADKSTNGLIGEASGGTLFLDEVGEIPLDLQAKLLRVLETGDYRRLGSPTSLQSNARIISASNVNFEEMIQKKVFRQDLFDRLNRFAIDLPSLNQRDKDIEILFYKFKKEFDPANKVKVSSDVLEKVFNHTFTGNIRELRTTVEAILIRAKRDDNFATLNHVPDRLFKDDENDLQENVLLTSKQMTELENKRWKNLIALHLEKAGGLDAHGAKSKAARSLEINESTLRGLIKKYLNPRTTENISRTN